MEKNRWDDLNMFQKNDIIKLHIKYGYRDLQAIRDSYNNLDEGGNLSESRIQYRVGVLNEANDKWGTSYGVNDWDKAIKEIRARNEQERSQPQQKVFIPPSSSTYTVSRDSVRDYTREPAPVRVTLPETGEIRQGFDSHKDRMNYALKQGVSFTEAMNWANQDKEEERQAQFRTFVHNHQKAFDFGNNLVEGAMWAPMIGGAAKLAEKGIQEGLDRIALRSLRKGIKSSGSTYSGSLYDETAQALKNDASYPKYINQVERDGLVALENYFTRNEFNEYTNLPNVASAMERRLFLENKALRRKAETYLEDDWNEIIHELKDPRVQEFYKNVDNEFVNSISPTDFTRTLNDILSENSKGNKWFRYVDEMPDNAMADMLRSNKTYKMDPNAVIQYDRSFIGHEDIHAIGARSHANSVYDDFASNDKYWQNVFDYTTPTKNIFNVKPSNMTLENYNYYTGRGNLYEEPTARMVEIKRDMVKEGIIDNITSEVSAENIQKLIDIGKMPSYQDTFLSLVRDYKSLAKKMSGIATLGALSAPIMIKGKE